MKEPRYVYSDSLEEVVVKGFSYKGEHYTWNDFDCVYYSDDCEENFFMNIPNGAIAD